LSLADPETAFLESGLIRSDHLFLKNHKKAGNKPGIFLKNKNSEIQAEPTPV
jgi:hypothetical protein